jgi:twitching motility protein PilT
MSAIRSLLRVMTLRDAEAITIEPRKPPALRRRGQLEALAMPPLDPHLIAAFAAPLLEGRADAGWPVIAPFSDADATYAVTIDQVADGLRLIVRRGAPTQRAPVAPIAPVVPIVPAAPIAPIGGPRAAPPERAHGPDLHLAPRDHAAPHARLVALLRPLVAEGRARGASDVIVSTGQPPRLRIDGGLASLEHAIDDDDLAACVRELADGGPGISADLALAIDGSRLRVSAFDHLAGHGLVARLIRDEVPGLAALGLPPELASLIDHRDGLVLVCGPTGSGKSTTVAALIDLLDQRRAAHVITLEDPIEFSFRPRRGIVHQRELGTHIPSFAAGLRAALREAPDVILLGELRDRETIAAALTAAETGHLVLATLHAPHAGSAIDRLVDAFPEAQQRQVRGQLALALRAIVTQHLVPRRASGRAAAIELCPVTPAVAAILRKGELQQLPTVIQSGRDQGMIPLERSLGRLVDTGAITPQVAKRFAQDHDLLAALAGR